MRTNGVGGLSPTTPGVRGRRRQVVAAAERWPPGPEVAAWPLVMRERGSRTRQLLEQRAGEQGVPLSYAVEAEGREAIRAIVAAGGGIGFVSSAEFGEDDPRLTRIPLDGPPLLMHEKLICLHERRNSKAIQAFFALAKALRG